jgi:hypothetical protein
MFARARVCVCVCVCVCVYVCVCMCMSELSVHVSGPLILVTLADDTANGTPHTLREGHSSQLVWDSVEATQEPDVVLQPHS